MVKLTDYLKTAEAARMLGVAQDMLRKWAGAGMICMHRNPVNGYRLFRRADLNKFLQAIERPVKPPARKRK